MVVAVSLVCSLFLRVLMFGFNLVDVNIFAILFILFLGAWVIAGQIRTVVVWMFNEFWFTGPKSMQGKEFTVIREGATKKGLKANQLVCGDILVVTPSNPFVPEDCISISKSNDMEDAFGSRLSINQRFLPRFSKIRDFGNSTSIYALVCSTSKTRLSRSIEPSETMSKMKKLEKNLGRGVREIFGHKDLNDPLPTENRITIEKLSFALNLVGVVIVINVMLLIIM